MISVENKNTKEYQAVRKIMKFFIPLFLIIFIFIVLLIVNHQFSFQSLQNFSFIFLIVLAFLNYLRNLSTTLYYQLTISHEEFIYESIKRRVVFKTSDIKRIFLLRQNDVTGVTNYLIIIRKGFHRNIFLSDQKCEDCDLTKLNTSALFMDLKVVTSTTGYLSQIILFFYLTLSL